MLGPAFADFDAEAFLQDYWQKRPLFIRDPRRAWSNPLDPDELAGLACEPGVESRLIARPAKDRWELEQGPLPQDRFADLGEHPWTLLVQAVDHHVPAVAALREPFRFIPNWRVDDVMVSYAVDGGGVGAHFDQYDVFLVQGLGRRRWRIGGFCDASTPLLPDDNLRLLAQFEPTEEWVLDPGDILYLPPGIAHDGVAIGDDCMTYSIGFRAPSRSELISAWTDHVLATLEDDDRYADPGLRRQDNPGEIAASALARLHTMVAETLLDPAAFAAWFGEYTTTPRSDQLDWRLEEAVTENDLQQHAARRARLVCNPASRFSFTRDEAGALTLFVDGQSYRCTGRVADFAERLCAGDAIALDAGLAGSPEAAALIVELFNRGCVAFEEAR